MKIGLVGAGNIGTTLARRLAAVGHDVKIANSRGPDTIKPEALENGARAVTVAEALTDVDVAILSIPLGALPNLRDAVASLPDETVVIDTSNYFPQRDGVISAIESGQVESQWVSEVLGRPITKAWNAINTASFKEGALPKGHPERIALPVAGDRVRDREVAIELMNDTGFDGYDAGLLSESWRQQPAAPAYCTELRYDELGPALAAAEHNRLPVRRDLLAAITAERMGPGGMPDREWGMKLARVLFI